MQAAAAYAFLFRVDPLIFLDERDDFRTAVRLAALEVVVDALPKGGH